MYIWSKSLLLCYYIKYYVILIDILLLRIFDLDAWIMSRCFTVWVWGEFVTHFITGPINPCSILSARDSIGSAEHIASSWRRFVRMHLVHYRYCCGTICHGRTTIDKSFAMHVRRAYVTFGSVDRLQSDAMTEEERETFVSGVIAVDHSATKVRNPANSISSSNPQLQSLELQLLSGCPKNHRHRITRG